MKKERGKEKGTVQNSINLVGTEEDIVYLVEANNHLPAIIVAETSGSAYKIMYIKYCTVPNFPNFPSAIAKPTSLSFRESPLIVIPNGLHYVIPNECEESAHTVIPKREAISPCHSEPSGASVRNPETASEIPKKLLEF